jgi:hypothetical protein
LEAAFASANSFALAIAFASTILASLSIPSKSSSGMSLSFAFSITKHIKKFDGYPVEKTTSTPFLLVVYPPCEIYPHTLRKSPRSALSDGEICGILRELI